MHKFSVLVLTNVYNEKFPWIIYDLTSLNIFHPADLLQSLNLV